MPAASHRLHLLAGLLVVTACDEPSSQPSASPPSATASAAAAAVFDVEGFCEKAVAVGRPCAGDDALREGNQIGLCTTTLRAARDDDGISLSQADGDACLTAVAAAAAPLPDERRLELLAERFEPCRKLLARIPALKATQPKAAGSAGPGEACSGNDACRHGHYCEGGRCAAQKPAGKPCKSGAECLGRCSQKPGEGCVDFCGSG